TKSYRSDSHGKTKASSVSARDGKANQAQTSRHPLSKRRLNSRNRWIYKKCCAGVLYKNVVAGLHDLGARRKWQIIRTIQGVRAAAANYAEQNELPPPPSRKDY